MKKLDYFLAAMQAGEQRRRAWVISAFSLIKEAPDAWKKDPYPYRIVQTPSGHMFVDPQSNHQLSPIDGTTGDAPPFQIKDKIHLKAGQVENLTKDIETTYGNLLFNCTSVIWPFGRKIDFMEGKVTAGQMEALVLPRLADDPKEGDPPAQGAPQSQPIYVNEYLKFADSMFYLAGFSQLCVPGATRKTMTAAPGIQELKAKLLEENKDRLHDPAIVAKIQQELIAYDRAYLKGDPGENFMITDKAFQVVRSKLFGMHGAESGLEDSADVALIKNSLSQGWDISKFPEMNNSLRAGSFNRGAQTMLGGESVKWLLRASSNIMVAQEDCGTRLGNLVEVTNDNYKRLTGFWLVSGTTDTLVTDNEAAGKYLGKVVTVRSPMFCKLDKTDYCSRCVGKRLSDTPTGLSSAVSEYGSAFLGIFLAAAHGKQLTLAKMNYKTAIF